MNADYAQMTVKLNSLLVNEQAKEAIDKAMSKYPLYQPAKHYDLIPTREEINRRILNNYKYREIGFETVGRFIDELEITLCEIMPFYNELYKTVETMAEVGNIFDNVDIVSTLEETQTEKTETEGERTGNQTAKNTTTANSLVESEGTSQNENKKTGTTTTDKEIDANNEDGKTTKFSDTPQNNVASIDNYLTTYTDENITTKVDSEEHETVTHNVTTGDTGSSTSKTEGTDNSETNATANESVTTTGLTDSTRTTRHTYTKKGNQGVNTYAHDMLEFRTAIRDITNEIVNDHRIESLFMLVW